MADIVLLTFNARFQHASFGLRYLKANLGELEGRCAILEFDLAGRPADVLEKVMAEHPLIVGLGVYVWNAAESLAFARTLKAVMPQVKLVLGGPEISFEHEEQPIAILADHIICGEADESFASLCLDLLGGQARERVINTAVAVTRLGAIAMPYRLYSDDDLALRTVYVESSRGCPFSCEFCLSSLDIPVRQFPLDTFLAEMQILLDRGCRQFKFVDRTFNAHSGHATRILQFFLDRVCPGLFLHFEIIPDHLPEPLFALLKEFPAGALQLEIGMQTFNAEVAQRIGRRQDNDRAQLTLRRLREGTHAHIHADLVAGLPGESLESFAAGFDKLISLRPHEIQLGILKRLRGTPIARHTQSFGMVYSPDAPYELLCNDVIDFEAMQQLKRFARCWDMYHNSGNFSSTLPLLISGDSPFHRFWAFSREVYLRAGRTHGIALSRQFEIAYEWFGKSDEAGELLATDYIRPGRRDVPAFLQRFSVSTRSTEARSLPIRQQRHLNGQS